MMNQVYKTLPDDRPITSLCVVDDVDRCPKGYVIISKTYDQDSDADLWRESGFFGRKCSRYLCLSKSEGVQDYVVQCLTIINEKEVPPQGFKTISKTFDSEQKAWRKKQLCYKFVHVSSCHSAVTDIIVLGRMKKAPEEFTLLGEINGMTICYKMSKNLKGNNVTAYSQVPYPLLPFSPESSPKTCSANISQKNDENLPSKSFVIGGGNGIEKYVADKPHSLTPLRPAPKPPTVSYATISGYNGLEGVPFILNPKFKFSHHPVKEFSMLKPKTRTQIDQEYCYEFRTERET